jgi:hypothetical protein
MLLARLNVTLEARHGRIAFFRLGGADKPMLKTYAVRLDAGCPLSSGRLLQPSVEKVFINTPNSTYTSSTGTTDF